MDVGKEEAASERKNWKGAASQVEKQWCKISIPETEHVKIFTQTEKNARWRLVFCTLLRTLTSE